MYTQSLLSLLALVALGTSSPINPKYQAPLGDLPPLGELPSVLPVDVWSAGVNFENIKGIENGHYCHVPRSKQILATDDIFIRPTTSANPDFHATLKGTMPVADTLPRATMTIAVNAVDNTDEPVSHTAPLNEFPNVVLVQRKHGFDAVVVVDGLAPFKDLAVGKHTVRLHAVVPDGRTLFCIEMDWLQTARAEVDDLEAWRGTRDKN